MPVPCYRAAVDFNRAHGLYDANDFAGANDLASPDRCGVGTAGAGFSCGSAGAGAGGILRKPWTQIPARHADRRLHQPDQLRQDDRQAARLGLRQSWHGLHVQRATIDRALADLTKAVEIDPTYAIGFTNRGTAYDSKNDHAHAIADFDAAIKLDPKSSDALIGRCAARAEQGDDLQAALSDCNQALQMRGNNSAGGAQQPRLRLSSARPIRQCHRRLQCRAENQCQAGQRAVRPGPREAEKGRRGGRPSRYGVGKSASERYCRQFCRLWREVTSRSFWKTLGRYVNVLEDQGPTIMNQAFRPSAARAMLRPQKLALPPARTIVRRPARLRSRFWTRAPSAASAARPTISIRRA